MSARGKGRRAWLPGALVLGLAGAFGLLGTGCSEYKYFEVHVKFDLNMFTSATAQDIQFCKVTVSGADSSNFRIGNCPPPVNALPPLDVGVFTYSSFADSGTMTFKLDAYTSMNELRPECIFGTGMTSIAVSSPMTIMTSLTVGKSGNPSCSDVTPPTDGGI